MIRFPGALGRFWVSHPDAEFASRGIEKRAAVQARQRRRTAIGAARPRPL